MRTTRDTRARARTVLLVVGACLAAAGEAAIPQQTQEPAAPTAVAPEQLQAAIDKLGDLDYPTRMAAARTVRRTANSQAAPALLRAVDEHADGYVRYRALVLLTGFSDPRTAEAMREAMSSPNDRLRTVAYSFFERNPEPEITQRLIVGVDKEQAEFVRPALVRALASAARTNPKAQQILVRDVARGEDFFRGAVIEALGDYKAQYAVPAILEVAKLDGPLQDDAVVALGKIGDKSTLETMAALQRSAPRNRQPSIASAICLLGVNCESHENFTVETLKFTDTNPGFQELLEELGFRSCRTRRQRTRHGGRSAFLGRYPLAGSNARARGAGRRHSGAPEFVVDALGPRDPPEARRCVAAACRGLRHAAASSSSFARFGASSRSASWTTITRRGAIIGSVRAFESSDPIS